MKLTPLADRVILKMLEAEETTKGGIILTASAKEKPSIAEVISVGPGGMVDGHDVVMTVKPGDKVITSKYSGTEVKEVGFGQIDGLVVIHILYSFVVLKEGAGSPFGFPAAQGGWVKVFLPRTCRGKNNLNYFRVPRNF